MSSLTERVKAKARALGFDLVGIAAAGPAPHAEALAAWLSHNYHGEMTYMARNVELRQDPRRLMPEVRSIIVLGVRYSAPYLPAAVHADPSRGRIAAYAWGPDYHGEIKPRLFALDAFIREETGRTTLARCYVDTGPVLERDWAMLAGLGFIGRNTCLIHPKLGSWLFLAVMLVPEELNPDPSPEPFLLPTGQPAWHLGDGRIGTCGQCIRCLKACPTQAFIDVYELDARRCISYLTIELRGPIPREMRPLMQNWIFGCDICQSVCPWSGSRTLSTPSASELEQWTPPLLELLALDETGFRQRFRGTAIQRAKRRGLLRNVCVAIGNWGSPTAIPALARALYDPEPLIRGHAAWALGRIGGTIPRACLQEALSREHDPFVIEEVRLALHEISSA
ncbi:MAG: DUF1730 domain-containing protein [Anaerolineae bacterium]|nr:DUF1730 domain-containing protein [Anaerolineae bacterium]MDW8100165.1 DUF1730 domain-containing protein [Anaerolineae bacterium]